MNTNGKHIDDDKISSYAESAARLLKSKGLTSAKKLCSDIASAQNNIKDAYLKVYERYGKSTHMPPACEWLLDNRYLAVREGKSAMVSFSREKHLRYSDDGIIIIELAKVLLLSVGKLSEERIKLFLEGCQKAYVLPRKELYIFPAALRAAIVLRISELCTRLIHTNEPEALDTSMAEAFTALRLISSSDMQSLLESVDVCEKLFRDDPAGIYPEMDDASREMYRERLSKLAKHNAMDEYGLAKHILKLCKNAEGTARHVGYHLITKPVGLGKTEKRGSLYIATNIIITLFLSLLCGFLSKSIAAALLLLLPLSELTKTFLDYIILLCVEPKRLPRMDLSDGVPDDARTVCVISALIADKEGIDKLTRNLEEFSLSNRGKGKNLLFGILADLPEAEAPVDSSDAALISAAKSAINELNGKYGDIFYLFTRPRVEVKGSGKFSGNERKRGAVLSLAQLLLDRDSELMVTAGEQKNLKNTKYIITLDSDTRPTPESLLELIGAMTHPLNRPLLDTENACVVSGHGIIHPRMGCEISSVRKTDFSRIFAGIGGTEPYSSLCGELYMDLYSRGGFSGKGIIDAESLLVCSNAHIPSGKVLSHDALEGAYLRGGFLSDTEFLDSFPSAPVAYYRRAHRWVRGDWQNSPWIFRRGPMSDVDRWKLFDSLRRSLVPFLTFAAIFLGLAFPKHGLQLAAWAAFLALVSRLLIAFTEFSTQRMENAHEKYHSRLTKGVTAAFIQTFLRLWFLPYEAWINISAALSSLWRMLISKKNLLQWETSAQSERKKHTAANYYLNMFLCPVSGLALILLSNGVFAKTAGLLWIAAPLAALALAIPSKNTVQANEADKKYLTGCAREIWSYFAAFCKEEDNFLPPDNFQEQPPVGLAHRTSPTNIGMALMSAVSAYEMNIDRHGALTVIAGMLKTLEKLPRTYGHFLNWYDTRTLRPLEPKYISTVDSGNLCACLISLKNWLRIRGDDKDADRVSSLIEPMDFSPLYDSSARLFYIGLDLEKATPSPSHYDLMASEARLTSYLAVAKGDVPRRHWRALSRALQSRDGYRGMSSWSGTMFEYLMPELFLPMTKDSLMYETAKYCMYVQKRRRSPNKLWGISESAFFALDPALNYCYKAHGCAHLALKRGQNTELVISPYSSFLALCIEPSVAIKNLRRLDNYGARGRYGFIEAIDFSPMRSRSSDGEKVRCYMSHHLGMSMLSIANYVNQNVIRELFMSEPAMSAHRTLLEEKLPVNTPTLKLNEQEQEKGAKIISQRWALRGESFDFESPNCAVLSNGMYSIMSTETGLTRAVCDYMLIYKPPFKSLGDGHGLEISLNGIALLPEPNKEYGNCMWELGETACSYTLINDTLRAKCSIAAGGTDNGEKRSIELFTKQDLNDAELKLSFEPVLADYNDYVNHPAYWRLGIEAYVDSGCLMLHRIARGRQADAYLCLACDRKMSLRADRNGALGSLSAPFVSATVNLNLNSGESLSLSFALCTADNPNDAFAGAQRILSMSPSEYGCMSSAAASRLGLELRDISSAMDMILPLWFAQPKKPFISKQKLWQYGISGDIPVICGPKDRSDKETVRSVTKQFFLLHSCGVFADLVFISDEGGDYERPVYSAVRDTLSAYGLEAFIGSNAGIRILPVTAEENVKLAASVIVGEDYPENHTGEHYELMPVYCRKKGNVPEFAFDKENSFVYYVNRNLPSRCWTDILSNGSFGYIAADSGCGNMWWKNAREMRINPWLNDPYAVSGPETLEYIAISGRYSLFADCDDIPCRIKFGYGFASWEKEFGDVGIRCTAFVPLSIDARVFIIETRGHALGQIAWKTELVLSGSNENKHGISVNYVNSIFSARNERSPISDAEFKACCSAPVLGWTGDLYSYLRNDFDGRASGLNHPIFGALFNCAPIIILACGCCDNENLKKLCQPEIAFSELDTVKQHRRNEVRRLRLQSAYPALNHYASGWAAYQLIACRLLGRCSIYQSGGAIGFRDQLQDAVNSMLLNPAIAREQILVSCAHQYIEGDVMHWWHAMPDGDKGVRTRCSDDLLWLVWALCEYTEKTGDTSICSENVNYVNSAVLSTDESDRYETPLRSSMAEPVIEHARRAVEQCVSRGAGMHGLLWFGSGDWNDGMDNVRGESVWLSWFFAHTVRRFADLLIELCKPDADHYRALAEKVGKAADSAWDGEWYLRAYWPDGTPIGSKKSDCCRIDSIAQSWAAFCSDASNSRIDMALDSAVNLLYDREQKIIKLFDPPFYNSQRDPGYIQSYGPGFRENGGQYTHAAIWLAMALIRRNRSKLGFEILNDLLPENHNLRTYAAEPFVLPADVYSAPGHEGEAGWTWYTGSAGWYFRVLYEELLGLKLWAGSLYIRPALPDDFPECRVSIIIGGKNREIAINGNEIFIDGEKYDGKGIPYA